MECYFYTLIHHNQGQYIKFRVSITKSVKTFTGLSPTDTRKKEKKVGVISITRAIARLRPPEAHHIVCGFFVFVRLLGLLCRGCVGVDCVTGTTCTILSVHGFSCCERYSP
jgi:hypothetical protein